MKYPDMDITVGDTQIQMTDLEDTGFAIEVRLGDQLVNTVIVEFLNPALAQVHIYMYAALRDQAMSAEYPTGSEGP